MTAETPDVNDTSDFRECLTAFKPRSREKYLAWCKAKVKTEQERPYDHKAYHHIGAPGGPADEWDNPLIRTIALEWGTRLGKTFFGQTANIHAFDTSPAPGIFVTSTEKLAIEATERTYRIVRQDPLGKMLALPEHEQRRDLIEYHSARQYIGWARSPSTLADKNCKYGHAAEIDKWEHVGASASSKRESLEGHPLNLFTERFKDYWAVRKVVIEGTPTLTGRSKIESLVQAGTNCRLYVPCPHCKAYQILSRGAGDDGVRLQWSRTEAGRTEPHLARQTAHYVCPECRGRIENHQRHWMLHRSVWCPHGCTVDNEAALAVAESEDHAWRGWSRADWIRGTPTRDSSDASYQLSSLYASSLNWSDYAHEWAISYKKPDTRHSFINNWDGETYSVRESTATWEQVGKRLRGIVTHGVVPDIAACVTVGVDVQADHFVYVVVAWGVDETGYVIDYGRVPIFGDVRDILTKAYPGEHIATCRPIMSGIDSGHRTDEIYGHCAAFGPRLLPTKGFDRLEKPVMPSSLDSSTSEERKRRMAAAKMHLWKFSKAFFHEELQARLDTIKPGEEGALILSPVASEDQDFLEQLLNNAQSGSGHNVIWAKIHDSQPDDYRDALVIARVVLYRLVGTSRAKLEALLAARRGAVPQSAAPQPFAGPGERRREPFVRRRGG